MDGGRLGAENSLGAAVHRPGPAGRRLGSGASTGATPRPATALTLASNSEAKEVMGQVYAPC